MDVDLQRPHRRYNPLTGEWVLCSPHRTERPWLGQVEAPAPDKRPAYDPTCYLCPGNVRAGGRQNPAYEGTFVFENDFSALLPDAETANLDEEPRFGTEPLLHAQSVAGCCRVLCYSPRHDLTLAEMTVEAIRAVVQVWAEEVETLQARYAWVQVFENKGAIMGCSNPHPHGQIWASSSLPDLPAREDRHQAAYLDRWGRRLLEEYLSIEIKQNKRIVQQNEHWVALVPFWAVWPFETLVLPRRHRVRLSDLGDEERAALAELLKGLLGRYDTLFQTSFPYSMGWHGAPSGVGCEAAWQLHAHILPPLLRSASVKKFMVGYELLAEAQRDLTAELAAARLRACPLPDRR